MFYDVARARVLERDADNPIQITSAPTAVPSKDSSASPSPSPPPPPPPNNGAVIAGIIMFLVAAAAAAACIWFIKRQKSRRRRRQYMAAARKASQAQEDAPLLSALDLDKPRTDSGKEGEEEEENDDDVILQNVNQVFESPPLQLKEPPNVSLGDRVVNSVLHLFGSKVPLGAARVRTTTGGLDTAAGEGGGGGVEEEAAPIVVNGRIQALYDEIMKPEQPKTGDYGILHEEVTPEAGRRSSSRRSTSFRPASELSTVSEVSLELMDREISTELMTRGGKAGTSGFERSQLDLILKQNAGRNQSGDKDSLGLGLGHGSSLTDVLGGESLGELAGGFEGGVAGGFEGGVAGDSLADELESSLPAGAAAAGAGGTEISSTGFIADRQNPNKYYSIAYTEYFMDD